MSNPTDLCLQIAYDTDVGLVRSENQDAVFGWTSSSPEVGPLGLLVVADGIGGFRSGDVASALAVDTLQEKLLPFLEQELAQKVRSPEVLEARLKQAVLEANRAIFGAAPVGQNGMGHMGTTIVAVLIQGDRMALAHVGDSRIYRLEHSGLELLTE
jgi:protein phosphatase